MPSPQNPAAAQAINFAESADDLKDVSEPNNSTKKKRKTRTKAGRIFLTPSIEVPPELLAAKKKIIDEIFGGYDAWGKAHDAGKKGGKFGLENISGIYIGQKRSGPGKGKPTAQLCVVIEVLKKADKAKLHREFRIPSSIMIGRKKVLTDIQVGKKIVPHAVIGGDLCGVNQVGDVSQKYEAGTIGYFCSAPDDDGKIWGCLLTNSHVIGTYLSTQVPFKASVQNPFAPNGTPIGYYYKSGRDGIDAALAFVKGSAVDMHGNEGLTIVSDIQDPNQGDTVLCYGGKTEAVVTGQVIKTGFDAPVDYPNAGHRVIEDTFVIQNVDGGPFSESGDSGSAIVKSGTNEPLGLLIGAMGSVSVAQRIGLICDELGIVKILSSP